MDNFNLWEFSLDIFNKISVVATKIWRLLTTTINDVVGDEEITTGSAIIDTIIDALVSKGITNIVIVRGYKKEKFDALLEKYPFIKFIDNEEYNK